MPATRKHMRAVSKISMLQSESGSMRDAAFPLPGGWIQLMLGRKKLMPWSNAS